MGKYLNEAVLPETYDNYVFDLYGTLVDIHTDEGARGLWEKLALFFGYYNACYQPEELKERYDAFVSESEQALRKRWMTPAMPMSHRRKLRLQKFLKSCMKKRG